MFQTTAVVVDRSAFINKVFLFFGLALGLSSVGVWGGFMLAESNPALMMNPVLYYSAYAVELVLALSVGWWQQKTPAAYGIFVFFALLSGFVTAPILISVNALYGAGIILKALIASTSMFVASALVGSVIKKDLSRLGGILFMALIGMVITSVLNIFLQSSMMEMALGFVGVLLFSAYTAYYIQGIKQSFPDSQFLAAAMGLYLSFVNLFMSVLRVLLAFAQE